MLNVIANRIRLLLRSELDLNKDRLLGELRKEFVQAHSPEAAVQSLGWHYEGDAPMEHLVGFGIRFDPVRHAHWLASIQWVALLVRDCGATLHLMQTGDIEIRIGAARLAPETPIEMAFLMEIFYDECYGVESKTPFFVWDIGANVGFAAVYFAALKGWDVAAYELCPPTAESAQRNIALSGMESKIRLVAEGIGGKNENLSIDFSPVSRGSNSLFGNSSWEEKGAVQKLDVVVRDASEVIDEVVNSAAGRPLLVKMDCEGAEYAALQRLPETDKLHHISVLILEAHIEPGFEPEQAVQTLLKGGFTVRRKKRLTDRATIIYATR